MHFANSLGSLIVACYLCAKSAVMCSCISHLIDRMEGTSCFLWKFVSFVLKVIFVSVVYWRNDDGEVGYDIVILKSPTVLQPAC